VETAQLVAADLFAGRLHEDDDWTTRMLFPDSRHEIRSTGELAPAYNLNWFDPELNNEQMV